MSPTENPVIRFARDLSNGDEKLLDQIRAYVATAPTDDETIGYYGSDAYDADARIWLATVSRLDESGYLVSSEDKYSNELITWWAQEGIINAEEFGPAAKQVFGPIVDDSISANWDDPAWVEQYKAGFRTNYVDAVRELETQFSRQGKSLLSVDDPGGDTMLFALVPSSVSERWKDKAFAATEGIEPGVRTQLGVRAPDWRRFWSRLSYSLDADWDEPPPTDLPAKAANLPMAE